MIHLFRHTNGKLKGLFGVAYVSKGKLIASSSSQGYTRKRSARANIISVAQMCSTITGIVYQDDTDQKTSVTYKLYMSGVFIKTDNVKVVKPYSP